MRIDEEKIIKLIAEAEDFELQEISPLSGGSINSVFAVSTSEGKRVIKINDSRKFPGMFPAEKKGLEILKTSRSFDIPEVYTCGEIENMAYLILEFKEEGNKHSEFWSEFAEDLSVLHKNSASYFGFEESNYIGSLPQFNEKVNSAAEFYLTQRLEPQLKNAGDRGFSFKNIPSFFKNISEEIPEEASSLIHGDLWSGNYLVNETGSPCLIDPAVCFGPREMDLAMMKLFGGFPEEVFQIYEEIFPLKPDFKNRISIWQLYYLLVHLNIFGSGYLPQVKRIIERYS